MARKVKHPLYRTAEIKHDYFSNENMLQFPERYVLVGFIAADGCIYDAPSGQNRLTFNISEKDACILDMINYELSNGLRHISRNTTTKSLMLYFPSDKICMDLAKWNIVPRKTYTYKMPSLDDVQMRYFLRGYFYGDGCVYNYHGKNFYSIIGTQSFCESLNKILVSLEIIDRTSIYKAGKSKTQKDVHFGGRQGSRVSKFMFHNEKMMLLPRKHIISTETEQGSRWFSFEDRDLLLNGVELFAKKSKRNIASILRRFKTLVAAGNEIVTQQIG